MNYLRSYPNVLFSEYLNQIISDTLYNSNFPCCSTTVKCGKVCITKNSTNVKFRNRKYKDN